jgi:hypothetical protein
MRRIGVVVAVAVAGALLPPARAPAASVSPNSAYRWDRVVLQAIKDTRPGPTIAARALAVAHTCMYDAWAAYDAVAVGTRLGGSLRRPAGERNPEAKAEAVSRAARMAAADLFPALAARFDAVLVEEGYDPATPPDDGSPAGVARQACQAVLDFRHGDGSNQLAGYADTTGYQPVNEPDHLSDPDRWQPLRTPDGTVQQFLTPHWGQVLPFAGGEPEALRPAGPPRAGTPARQAEVDEMVRLSGALSDEDKVIAEYWADGVGTELPPGHWMIFGQFCSRRDTHGLDDDVKLFFVLANAMLDASISAWEAKRRFDSVRPISLVRHVYAGKPVSAWGGPYRGTQTIDGSQWRPYIATPPFAEYTSGHSTFSAAGAGVLRALTGRSDFGASVLVPAGSSRIEPGAVPAHDVVLRWATFDDAADQAGMSRRLGGIHFLTGDLDGRLAGRRVAARVAARARTYFLGAA